MRKHLKILLLTLIAFSPLQGVESTDYNKIDAIQGLNEIPSNRKCKVVVDGPKDRLKAAALSIATLLFNVKLFPILTIIPHELGHALFAKWFTGKSIDIHLGDLHKTYKTPLFKINGLTIHEIPHFFSKGLGWSNLTDASTYKKYAALSPLKKALVSAGGGIVELPLMYLIMSTIAGYREYKKSKKVKHSMLYGLKNAFHCFDRPKEEYNIYDGKENTINNSTFGRYMFDKLMSINMMGTLLCNALYCFFPGFSNSDDGSKLWRYLGVTNANILFSLALGINTVTPVILFLYYVVPLIKDLIAFNKLSKNATSIR